MKRLQRFQRFVATFSHEYEFMRWIVYIFVGGGANALAMRLFAEWYWPAIQGLAGVMPKLPLELASIGLVYGVVILALPGIPLFLTPVGLALLLMQFYPEKRIVPPLYMQLIAAVFITPFVYGLSSSEPVVLGVSLFVLSLYVVVGGLVQDRITTSLVGITTDRNNILRDTFELDISSEAIVQRLLSDPFREHIGLRKNIDCKGRMTILKTRSTYKYETIIGVMPKEDNAQRSLLAIVVYEKTRYYLRRSPDMEETFKSTVAYLRDIFDRPPDCHAVFSDAPDNIVTPLVDDIVDKLQGARVRHVSIGWLGWLKFGFFVGAIVVAGVILAILHSYTEAAATIALILLYLAFELPSKLRRD